MEENSSIKKTQQKTKQHIVISILSFFLMVFCIIAGFFAWQTQKLSGDIKEYKMSTTMQPSPIANKSKEWKTYADEKYKFEIKYPSFVEPTREDSTIYENYNDFINFKNTSNGLGLFSIGVNTAGVKKEVAYIRSKTEGHIAADLTKNYKVRIADYEAVVLEYTKKNDQSEFNAITHIIFSDGKNTYEINIPSNLYEQIVPTFIFKKNDSANLNSVSCTMEAKICPDGSSVGRSGPKCEFSPCPTPKD
jgi:hypothetical protein